MFLAPRDSQVAVQAAASQDVSSPLLSLSLPHRHSGLGTPCRLQMKHEEDTRWDILRFFRMLANIHLLLSEDFDGELSHRIKDNVCVWRGNPWGGPRLWPNKHLNLEYRRYIHVKLQSQEPGTGWGVTQGWWLAPSLFSVDTAWPTSSPAPPCSAPSSADGLACQNLQLAAHSGFNPFDWPIWTDFVGRNFRLRALFFG